MTYCYILPTMDSRIAKEVISLIRVESERRSHRLSEDPDVAYHQWRFTDEPFINEMCLMVLVAVRHQVERELVCLAARAGKGQTITRREYQQSLEEQRKRLRDQNKKQQTSGWNSLIATLKLDSLAEWSTSMETLRLLANSLKHEPTQQPDKKLLEHLKLPLKPEGRLTVGYAPLAESRCFREGLAASIGLPIHADYCAIADSFVDLASQFLGNVQRKNKDAARVTGPISIVEFVC